ncbi:MAG TPA: ABC transporter permease [Dehalococcoidia bacterium]|nr:ABC transporter permease [Dehalococcoidia bacterium]
MADNSSGRVAETKRHSAPVGFLIRLVKEKPLGTAGGIITLLLLVTGIFAEFLAPYGMNQSFEGYFLTPPSAKFWLGTDNVGRDILSRVIYGARISVIVGLATATLATIMSVIIGIMSGYIGGKVDMIGQRFVDAVMCIPALPLLMVVVSVTGVGLWQVIVSLGVYWGIVGSRHVRSFVIGIKENAYVEAARAIGCPTSRILTRHILPNTMAPTIILFSARVPNAILTEASLSFLGFGIPPPQPSWGGMLSGGGRQYMPVQPGMALWPGFALALVVYGVNLFGDAVRDLLDPRLRGGVGRYGVRKPKKSKKGDAAYGTKL